MWCVHACARGACVVREREIRDTLHRGAALFYRVIRDEEIKRERERDEIEERAAPRWRVEGEQVREGETPRERARETPAYTKCIIYSGQRER